MPHSAHSATAHMLFRYIIERFEDASRLSLQPHGSERLESVGHTGLADLFHHHRPHVFQRHFAFVPCRVKENKCLEVVIHRSPAFRSVLVFVHRTACHIRHKQISGGRLVPHSAQTNFRWETCATFGTNKFPGQGTRATSGTNKFPVGESC
jgi:hypothetical protein